MTEKCTNKSAGKITEADWEVLPGLEIAWLEWFEKLGII